MTMRGDRFVDTTIFLTATAAHRTGHAAAVALLEAGSSDRSMFISGQVLRECLVLATRPMAANGLGLALPDALENVTQFRERANLLGEDASVHNTLMDLMKRVPSFGKQIHDANIGATMIAHGVLRLVTLNPGDFARFAPEIQVSGLD